MEREELVAQLATAVRHRDHWRLDGLTAVYERPGMVQAVRIVVPPQEGIARQRVAFRAVIIQGGTARFSRPCHTVAEAITWAEQVPLE